MTLLQRLAAAKEKGVAVKVGNLFSADLFYTPDVEMFDVMEKYGILGVEMEARCCNKLLAKGSAILIEIKCNRCKTMNKFH